MLDTHGLPMVGIKRAANMSKDARPYERYLQITYYMENGKILLNEHESVNSWTRYAGGPEFLHICTTDHAMTMQEISDRIYEAVSHLKMECEMMLRGQPV